MANKRYPQHSAGTYADKMMVGERIVSRSCVCPKCHHHWTQDFTAKCERQDRIIERLCVCPSCGCEFERDFILTGTR